MAWHIYKPVRSPYFASNEGGGIVFDSDPYEEYIETLNKLKSNITTIQKAEELYARMLADGGDTQHVLVNGEENQQLPNVRVGKGL